MEREQSESRSVTPGPESEQSRDPSESRGSSPVKENVSDGGTNQESLMEVADGESHSSLPDTEASKDSADSRISGQDIGDDKEEDVQTTETGSEVTGGDVSNRRPSIPQVIVESVDEWAGSDLSK